MVRMSSGCKIYLAGTYGLGGGQWLGGMLDVDISCGDVQRRGGKGNYLRPLLENRGICEGNDGGNGNAAMALRERERVKASQGGTFDQAVSGGGRRSHDMGVLEQRGGV